MEDDRFCITVTVLEASTHCSLELDAIRLVLIPFLLESPVKGKKKKRTVLVLLVVRVVSYDVSCRLRRD